MRQNDWFLSTALTIACLVVAAAVAGGDEPASSTPPAATRTVPAEASQSGRTMPRSSCVFAATIRSSRWLWRPPSRGTSPKPTPTNPTPGRRLPHRGRAAATTISVDLIGAVHVGEPQYYDQLNELFTDV